MSKPSADSAAPASLGWLAAHALEGLLASPWKSGIVARVAAESVRSLARESSLAGGSSLAGDNDPESAWSGFSKPFRAIEAHVASLQDPLRTGFHISPAGIAVAANADLQAFNSGKQAPASSRHLSEVGRAIGEAVKGAGSPVAPKAASWVETGNPSVRPAYGRTAAGSTSAVSTSTKPGAEPPGSTTMGSVSQLFKSAGLLSPPHPSHSQPAAAASQTPSLSAPANPVDRVTRLIRAVLPPAPTALQIFAQNLQRKREQAEVRTKVPAPKLPVSAARPKRKPFLPPEVLAELAGFREILDRQIPESPAAPDAQAGATFPASPAEPKSSRTGGTHSSSQDTVTPKVPVPLNSPLATGESRPGAGNAIQKSARPGPHPYDSGDTAAFTPAPSPASARGPASIPAVPDPSPRGPDFEPAPAASLSRPRPSEMEWLDEEDDLAARLHSLLRRQARRHGVDLS